jgi:hypothetical protein
MIESFMLGGAIVIGISVTVTAILLAAFEVHERWNKHKH